MPTEVPEEEKDRRRGIDRAGDALNVIYEQLKAAVGPSLQNTRDLSAGPEGMKATRDKDLANYNRILAEKGKPTLTERHEPEVGETVGDSMQREVKELSQEEQRTRGKRSRFRSEAGSASKPGFTTPEDRRLAGTFHKAAQGGLVKGDMVDERIRRIANRRADLMARGGAAPGLAGEEIRQLPKPKDPPPKAASKKLDADARAKAEAIRDYMETLNLTQEEAEAFWNRQRAKSDRPTG